jgi:NAD(P)H-hydrate repair Nnr-like enzyme with NAD(P)H-hydrate dehydratase domain
MDCFASLAMTVTFQPAWSWRMTKKTVLAIGIDPSFVDYSAFPGLTAELVSNFIEAQIAKLRVLGYDAESCLIDLGDTAEMVAKGALVARPLDCVVIGAGLREPPERLLLFEKILNLVRVHAPHAAICFNTTPADTAEAVQRWVKS